MDKDMKIAWLIALLAAVVYGSVAYWGVVPRSTDMTLRYAPMADAFARGDWYHAFHPRMGTVFQILTGTLCWVTGMAGNKACQLVAVLAWCFATVPLFALARRLFGRQVAFVSLALYLANIDLAFLSFEGWRDNVRILPTLLVVLGFVLTFGTGENRRPIRGCWAVAVGMAVLVMLRVDCFVICSLALAVYVVMCAVRRQWLEMSVATAGWGIGTIAQCVMVSAYTGWWVPVPQAIRFLGGGVAC